MSVKLNLTFSLIGGKIGVSVELQPNNPMSTSYTSTTPTQLEEMRKSGQLHIHTTATKSGYISRKCAGVVREYRGRYGVGYVLDTPRFDTSRYHNRTYYIHQ